MMWTIISFLSLLIAVGIGANNISSCYDICICDIGRTTTDVDCVGNSITVVPENIPLNTTNLYLTKSKIKMIRASAFSHLAELKELYIKEATELIEVQKDAFHGLENLEILQIYGCDKLKTIGYGALHSFRSLHTLYIRRSGLIEVPDFSVFNTSYQEEGVMQEIDLSVNRITSIQTGAFRNVKAFRLLLENNAIQSIDNGAFEEAHVTKLYLTNNTALSRLESEAFSGIGELTTLDMSGTSIRELPTIGLEHLQELVLQGTPSLRRFPSVVKFTKLKEAKLTYPHHCCAFKNPEKQNPAEWEKYEKLQREVRENCATTVSPSSQPLTTTVVGMGTFTLDPWRANRKKRSRSWDQWSSFGGDDSNIGASQGHNNDNGTGFGFGHFPESDQEYSLEDQIPVKTPNIGIFEPGPISLNDTNERVMCGQVHRDIKKVVCSPEPDAFNPCEDVMGYEWLRVIVWFVLLAAILGNLVVIAVLLSNKSKMSVAKFLMCNLAFADFLMGAYLLILASIDIHTLGEYFNYAIAWQNEGGCQTAGFLTVFSSELSVYTLSVITLERWYAISHAIHLTKRLKMRQACAIMGAGWMYAVTMAFLPLVGVSGYGTVSICLPMEISNSTDIAYVLTILILNGLAFIVVCASYVNMYWRVRGSDSTARSSDATIAKRMALLVFTNFACWAPIAFFGLTASAGIPLIDITNSKVLLVFFYPLNSCANPFLYAILTKQFRRDLFLLLSKYGLCTRQANKYKGAVSSRSIIHSRNNSIAMHNMSHNATIMTQLSDFHRGSKVSLGSLTPKTTPQSAPHSSPQLSPQSSPKVTDKSLLSVLVPHGSERNKEGRKLSTVLETSQTHDDVDMENRSTSNVKKQNGSSDPCLGDEKYLSRIRSVSEYGFSCSLPSKDSARGKTKVLVEADRKTSQDVSISSATDTSVISDSSHGDSLGVHREYADTEESQRNLNSNGAVGSNSNGAVGSNNGKPHPLTKHEASSKERPGIEAVRAPLLWNGKRNTDSEDSDDEDSEADVNDRLVRTKPSSSLRTPIHPLEKCTPLKV